MRKKKKIKTIIVEKFKYDDDDCGVVIDPALLLKLLEFAHEEAKSDEQLHAIVTRAHMLSHELECLEMDDYYKLVSEPLIPVEIPMEVPVEVPVIETETKTVESA